MSEVEKKIGKIGQKIVALTRKELDERHKGDEEPMSENEKETYWLLLDAYEAVFTGLGGEDNDET